MRCGKHFSTFHIAENVPLCHDATPLFFLHCLYSHSSIIFGASVAKTTKLLSVLLKRGNNQKRRTKEGVFFIQLVYNGDMKADRNGARLPA